MNCQASVSHSWTHVALQAPGRVVAHEDRRQPSLSSVRAVGSSPGSLATVLQQDLNREEIDGATCSGLRPVEEAAPAALGQSSRIVVTRSSTSRDYH
jgi:hypothetical protein